MYDSVVDIKREVQILKHSQNEHVIKFFPPDFRFENYRCLLLEYSDVHLYADKNYYLKKF